MSGPPEPPPKLDPNKLGLPSQDPDALSDPALDAPLIPRYLPANRFHVFGASPSTGKSTLLAQLALSLTTGADFFGLPVNRKSVKFLFTDRSCESNMAALRRVGLEELPVLSLVDSPTLLERERQLLKAGSKLPGITLLQDSLTELGIEAGDVIISDVHTNAFCGDVHRQATLGPILRHTNAMCLTQKFTLIATAYGVKIVTDQAALYARLVDRIIGAASMRGSAETMMYLTHPEENGDSMGPQRFQIVSREAKPLNLDLVNKGGLFVLESVEESANRAERLVKAEAKRAPAREAIIPYVPFGEGGQFEDICKQFGDRTGRMPVKSTIAGWLKDLAEEGKVESPKYGVWRRKES